MRDNSIALFQNMAPKNKELKGSKTKTHNRLLTAIVMLLTLLPLQTQAFYTLEPLIVGDSRLAVESSGTCEIQRVENLISYQCSNYFYVINLALSLEGEAKIIYETTKAVQQVRPSKITNKPFFSFMEASSESSVTVPTYANLKVVDSQGELDIGLNGLVPS